jgi:hypothetical protein
MKMYINKFKLEFETTEIIKITNSGNARAYFKWLPSPNDTKLFTISPKEGFVEANSFYECKVTYIPN